jgi:hypothetical protein
VSEEQIQVLTFTAAEAREHLAELEEERAVAVISGVAEIDTYIHDLDLEIELWEQQYVLAAVTEIATLRAELHGPAIG